MMVGIGLYTPCLVLVSMLGMNPLVLRRDLEALGFAEAELVPTDGHPGV